ncbi:MAG: thioredoxin family protein [Pseudanabaenaceae cyanobacterium SKYGB_i_bin29]|nr:thioredoxin family protein [Pseudanabaenaceae cyanobacterium SKYG29]MDW8420929.1 thioredoxin family protein [Pseudanabaenaceae cyanobacterium SKYGB_i_bin29]
MRYLLPTFVALSLPALVASAHRANKIESVGNPLPAAFQDKPAIVQIKSRNCPMCRKMEPIVQEVKDKYKGKVTFITFDITDSNSLQEARKVAATVKLTDFFAKHGGQMGLILAVDPRSGKVLEQFSQGSTVDTFTKVLDEALAELAKK